MIQRNRFLEYVDAFRSARILVIGSATAEFDVACQVRRLAPDRAMPVYELEHRSAHPGGAALTASTIRNLGASVTLLAPVGRGVAGQALRSLLDEEGIELIEAGNGESTTPELFRYLAGGRQLLQVRRNWSAGEFRHLDSSLRDLESRTAGGERPFDVICIVDAMPSGLTPDALATIGRFATSWQAPIVFDEAGAGQFPPAASVDHLIVNEAESRIAAKRHQVDAEDSMDRLCGLCRSVAPTILLTLGRQGGVVATRGEEKCEIAPITTPVHALSDRRGVGFVLSGVYALCVAVNASAEEAGFLACNAASIAAGSPGPKRLRIDEMLGVAYREIESHVADGIEVFGRIARHHLHVIDEAARVLMQAYTEGKQVLVFGNGGSAAEANHLVTELTGQFRRKRASLPSISLSSNDALATCIANDYGFEDLFARQVEAFCRPGDVVIGMSTSGRSKNVVRAMERARERGGRTIAFTGEEVGPMHELAEIVLAVPSRSTPRIQEAHLFAIHVMCDMLDRRVDAEGQLHPSASEI